MTFTSYPRPALDDGLAPFLFWNEIVVSANGAALACPRCAGANLHLGPVDSPRRPTAATCPPSG
jgi:hypothetical protein